MPEGGILQARLHLVDYLYRMAAVQRTSGVPPTVAVSPYLLPPVLPFCTVAGLQISKHVEAITFPLT